MPTLMEQGLKDFSIQSWIMIYAPAGASPEIARRLYDEIGKALQGPKLKKIFEEQSMLAMPVTYDGLKPFMVKEVATWKELVQVSGATVE